MIEIKKLGKRYNITHMQGGYVALRDVLTYVLKRPFSFLKTKARRAVGLETKEEFWALKDVSFAVQRGEVVGIIGHNGAGKSTLLKILTGITPPTKGEAVLRGRVSSLLEVGTGFHPELTGRENIFLNGAILGMTRREIARKFDEIVEFAGVTQFLDMPVKYYSSGMYVRLAFSVAAHMEPDILIVDEVLAVGDAEFQKKCLGKMEEVTHKEGRTILFVSHNMAAVQNLCDKVVLLKKGQVVMFDETSKVIEAYAQTYARDESKEWSGDAGDEQVRLTHTEVRSLDQDGVFHNAAPLEVTIAGEIKKPVRDLIWGFSLSTGTEQRLAYSLYDDREESSGPEIPVGPFSKTFIIPANSLSQGMYRIEIDIGIHRVKRIIKEQGSLSFELVNVTGLGRRFHRHAPNEAPGMFRPDWSVNN